MLTNASLKLANEIAEEYATLVRLIDQVGTLGFALVQLGKDQVTLAATQDVEPLLAILEAKRDRLKDLLGKQFGVDPTAPDDLEDLPKVVR